MSGDDLVNAAYNKNKDEVYRLVNEEKVDVNSQPSNWVSITFIIMSILYI